MLQIETHPPSWECIGSGDVSSNQNDRRIPIDPPTVPNLCLLVITENASI